MQLVKRMKLAGADATDQRLWQVSGNYDMPRWPSPRGEPGSCATPGGSRLRPTNLIRVEVLLRKRVMYVDTLLSALAEDCMTRGGFEGDETMWWSYVMTRNDSDGVDVRCVSRHML